VDAAAYGQSTVAVKEVILVMIQKKRFPFGLLKLIESCMLRVKGWKEMLGSMRNEIQSTFTLPFPSSSARHI
jgi:hypothetical protein